MLPYIDQIADFLRSTKSIIFMIINTKVLIGEKIDNQISASVHYICG